MVGAVGKRGLRAAEANKDVGIAVEPHGPRRAPIS